MKQVQLGQAVRAGSITIIPMEELIVSHHRFGTFTWIHVQKQPAGVVVRTSAGKRAFDMDGSPMPVERSPRSDSG